MGTKKLKTHKQSFGKILMWYIATRGRKKMKTHTTFFSGKTTESQSIVSYILALSYVFSLCLVIEWLSNARLIKYCSNDNVKAGFLQTLLYGFRAALAYLVMLSVMSFDMGIILSAIAGYSIGFLVFNRLILMLDISDGPADLPPLTCR